MVIDDDESQEDEIMDRNDKNVIDYESDEG